MILLIVLGLAILAFILFLQNPIFGRNPSGPRLKAIILSRNFNSGSFQNPEPTVVMRKEASYLRLLQNFFNPDPDAEPDEPLNVVKRKIEIELSEKPVITWFGHSSYLVQYNGFNLLVDPVFYGRPSPLQALGPKYFRGTQVYNLDDLPKIDAVLITHDHYDHLEYQTIRKLKDSDTRFYTSLGVGSHLERWGIKSDRISELDWWEEIALPLNIKLTATPARHFSGRGFTRAKTLWSGFVLESESWKIYLGGDSGYSPHFKKIGEKFGPFDLAILECGQYNVDWPQIHMMPEETVQAALDLNARVLMPVHWGKFRLALHSWKEPVERVRLAAQIRNLQITTPKIGESVKVNSDYPNEQWWNA